MELLNSKNQFTKIVLEVKKKKRVNKVFDDFLLFLNPPRVEKKLRPITYARLGFLLSHLDDWDKSIFLGSCKNAKNPSAFFWYSLKIKRDTNK